ncbi:hypothetical protein AB0H49_05885 [Nocardia sp. NPDC050713]|uniref:hypothetical protein n=1 Tax=Nocardia sp. NPDC050713 TaxID=3154511 RepID=UPI0033F403E0
MEESSSSTLGVCVRLTVIGACFDLLAWHADLLAMAEDPARKTLMATWFVLGWGFAPGVLTWLVIQWASRHLPAGPAAGVIAAAGLSVTVAVCYPMYLYIADPAFMAAAMGTSPGAAAHAGHHSAGPVVSFEVLLVPTLIVVGFAIANAIGPASSGCSAHGSPR